MIRIHMISIALILYSAIALPQEYNSLPDNSGYLDSIETYLRSSSTVHPKDLKNFLRAEAILGPRLDDSNSVASFINARTSYFQAKKYQKAASINDLTWEFVGPNRIAPTTGIEGTKGSTGKGWVWSLYINPEDEEKITVGTHSAGVWETTDGGDTWTPLTDEVGEILGARGIVRQGDTILCTSSYSLGGPWGLGYAEGVYRTFNGGTTWTAVNNGALSTNYPTTSYLHEPRRLYVNPYNDEEIYLVTYKSVYKTTNYGNSWTLLLSHDNTWATQSYGFYDIEIVRHLYGDQDIYVSGSTVWKLPSASSVWQNITNAVITPAFPSASNKVCRVEMATHTNYRNKVWFYVKELDRGSDGGIVKWDGSSYSFLGKDYITWSPVRLLTCEVSPNDEDVLYFGSVIIGKFDINATPKFKDISSKALDANSHILGGTNWVHADNRDMKIVDVGGTDKIYLAHDGGVSWGEWSTSDNRYNFSQISDDGTDGLHITEIYGIGSAQSSQERLIIGTQDLSLFVYGANGYTNLWTHNSGGDGGDAVVNPHNPSQMYELNYLSDAFNRSLNGGVNFSTTYNVHCNYQSQVVYEPVSNRVFVGVEGGVLRFNNPTVSLTDQTTLTPTGILSDNFVSAIEFDPNDNDIMYISVYDWYGLSNHPSNQYYMWKSTDGGASYVSISEYLTQPDGSNPCHNGSIPSIEVNPSNSNEVWCCFNRATNDDEKVFHSIDGGLSWSPLSTNYPDDIPAHKVLYDEFSERLYVATDVGVLYWDSSSGWISLGQSLPKKMITDMVINNNLGKLYVSTYGRGVWSLDLSKYFCFSSEPDIEITSATIWSTDDVKCGNITIKNNSTLTITADIIQSLDYTFSIESGSTLVVNGGYLRCGEFLAESGADFSILSGGEIGIMVE